MDTINNLSVDYFNFPSRAALIGLSGHVFETLIYILITMTTKPYKFDESPRSNRVRRSTTPRLLSPASVWDWSLNLEGWIVTSSMLTTRQTNRPKSALTSICMEVTYKCRLLGFSFSLLWPTLLACSSHASMTATPVRASLSKCMRGPIRNLFVASHSVACADFLRRVIKS